MRRAPFALTFATTVALAACGGGSGTSPTASAAAAPGGTPAPAGGGQATGMPITDVARLCDLLGPGDFDAVGIAGTEAPTANSDEPGSAYCAYTAASAANGGVEFDVFVGDDPAGTYQTILGEIGSVAPSDLAGVDEAASADGIAGQPDKPATVVARRGKLVFTIAAPGGPNNSVMLEQLAALVLARGAGLAG